MRRALGGLIAVVLVAPAVAHAERDPWAPGTPASSFARPDGAVRVHYVTTTADAVLAADADSSGVPDFVEEVAARGDEVLARYAALGFRAPLADGALGGDARLDLYLRNLAGADGSFEADSCNETPFTCAGSVTIENDFAGYPYPSTSIAIRVLVSHELFHAVQAAYDDDQPIAWSEGSAVWAEELVYPEQDDFEHLVAAFLAKPFRPFERPGAGFGDLYPYGAGLWPYFLEARYGAGIVRAAWEGCEDHGSDPDFLAAISTELVSRDLSLAAAWIEFTRWNARTGARAGTDGYPDAGRLPLALREPPLASPGSTTLSIEGLSARYLPLPALTTTSRVELHAMRPLAALIDVTGGTAEIVREGNEALATDHAFVVRVTGGADVELIVSGATGGGLAQEVMVTIAPYDEPIPEGIPGGCCGTSRGSPAGSGLLAGLIALALRRRSISSPRTPWPAPRAR